MEGFLVVDNTAMGPGKKTFDVVERKVRSGARLILEQSIKSKKNPREVALAIAKEKVEERSTSAVR